MAEHDDQRILPPLSQRRKWGCVGIALLGVVVFIWALFRDGTLPDDSLYRVPSQNISSETWERLEAFTAELEQQGITASRLTEATRPPWQNPKVEIEKAQAEWLLKAVPLEPACRKLFSLASELDLPVGWALEAKDHYGKEVYEMRRMVSHAYNLCRTIDIVTASQKIKQQPPDASAVDLLLNYSKLDRSMGNYALRNIPTILRDQLFHVWKRITPPDLAQIERWQAQLKAWDPEQSDVIAIWRKSYAQFKHYCLTDFRDALPVGSQLPLIVERTSFLTFLPNDTVSLAFDKLQRAEQALLARNKEEMEGLGGLEMCLCEKPNGKPLSLFSPNVSGRIIFMNYSPVHTSEAFSFFNEERNQTCLHAILAIRRYELENHRLPTTLAEAWAVYSPDKPLPNLAESGSPPLWDPISATLNTSGRADPQENSWYYPWCQAGAQLTELKANALAKKEESLSKKPIKKPNTTPQVSQ